MVIKSLELSNFRNYSLLNLSFDRGTNILYGDNAQGKTNILEAIYLCATTKSHKGAKDKDIVNFNEEEAHIRAYLEKKEDEIRIDMHLRKNKAKGVAINGLPIKKARELLGVVNLVFFSPEDLNIIKDGPAGRRRFMDMELSQLDSIYLHNLTKYHKILQQRNKLLKDIHYRPDLEATLPIWDEQLVLYGTKIIQRRQEFLKELNDMVRDLHQNISGNRETLQLVYEPSATAEDFAARMEEARVKDLKMGMTSYGPHRDDISFLINETDIRKYGSQGQQRTSALSLKLAEIELVKQLIHDTPVLLLDDVLSELDSNRQNYLLNSIHDIQTIITCTGLDEFVKNRFHINKVFFVREGTIAEQ